MPTSKQITKRITIDQNKRYCLPRNIALVSHNSKILVISPDTANWFVCDNGSELYFFQLLQQHSIKEALDIFDGSKSEALNVITQIEARHFERTDVKSVNEKKLQLFLTNGCNLKCPFCYMDAGIKNESELTLEEVQEILSSFSRNGGQRIVLTGGEIKTRKDIFDIIQFSHDLGLRVELLTNGCLWSEEEIRRISPIISNVQISIDGYDEKSNSKVRGKGNFSKAITAVDTFIHNGVHVDVAITPLYDSTLIQDIDKYSDFGLFLIKKYTSNCITVNFTADLLSGRDFIVTEKYHHEYARIVNQIYLKAFGDVTDNPFIKVYRNHEIYDNCSYGNLAISSIGDVYLCGRITCLKPIGNIRSKSIESFFDQADKARELSNVNNLEPCSHCEVKYICGGECRLTYFSGFKDNSILYEKVKGSRSCTQERKNFIYDLMIRTNKRLFE